MADNEMSELPESLLQEWSGDGFFYLARHMTFDQMAAERFLRKLDEINPSDHSPAESAELLRRIWHLPYYALVYREGCLARGADERQYDRFRIELGRKVEEKFNALLSRCGDHEA